MKKQLLDFKEKIRPSVKNLALDLGLIDGHQDYTRFVILGRSRCGSNMLRSLMNAHPQILTFGEMFKNPEIINWDLYGYPNDGSVLNRFQTDITGFIEKDLFRTMPRKIQAVGFKIFYYHAFGTPLEPVWNYLLTSKEVHVLHIKRHNILKTHVSKKRAELSDSWIDLTGDGGEVQPIQLDFNELKEDFLRTRNYELKADEMFASHPKMEIIYEEFARNYSVMMPRIQKFLGVEQIPVSPQTHKQTRQTLAKSIQNYFELKEQFRGSPWEEFFTD